MDYFGHLAFLLVAVSLIVKDILWLRLISIGASMASIIFNYRGLETHWLVINWNLIFIGINAMRSGLLVRERMMVHFSDEERELYETVFKNFTPVEMMKFLRIGEWRSVAQNFVLSRQREPLDWVYLIYNGEAEVFVDEKKMAVLKDGDFIGEMSFTLGHAATATVVMTQDSKILAWKQEELRKLLDRNPSMKLVVTSILSTDMVKKLKNADS